ncbi:MAG: DUF6916 family protein, partial [Acidimicrobiales bacterium]
FSRRTFLVGTATVAAMAVIPVIGAAPALAQARSSILLRHNFTPLVQRSFQLVDDTDTTTTTVTLTHVSDLTPEASPGTDLRFSLMFEGESGKAAPQGIYQLQQRSLGNVQVLVVPVGMHLARPTYQVIVNNPG